MMCLRLSVVLLTFAVLSFAKNIDVERRELYDMMADEADDVVERDGGFSKSDYFFSYPMHKNYADAEKICTSKGMALVEIRSMEENKFLFQNGGNKADPWIGLNDRTTEGNYVWQGSDCTADFTNFNPGEPSNHRGENCVHFLGNQKWNDLACGAAKPFICGKFRGGKCKKLDERGYFRRFQGNQYFIGVQDKTFTEAQSICTDVGMRLARIDSAAENDYLFKQNWKKEAWIGLNAIRKAKVFVWQDGCKASYQGWSPGQPDNGVAERCVHYLTNGKWNDLPCPNRRRFICKAWTGPECEQEDVGGHYKVHNGKKFFFGIHPKSWTDARAECRKRNMDLAQIDTEGENRFIYDTNKHREIWFGLNDRLTEGNYIWAGTDCPNTHIMFRKYNPGEPSNNRVENCIHHLTNANWNDLTCSAVRLWVCSVPPVAKCKKEDGLGYHRFYKNKRYFIGIKPKTYADAQKDCNSRGMELARIGDADTNDYLFKENWNKEAWIGLNAIRRAKTFVWQDGCKPSYQGWSPGQPDNGVSERCVHYLTNGKWNDLPCNNQRRYICSEINKLKCAQDDPGGDYRDFKGKRFFFGLKPYTWPKAQEECRKRKMDLAQIDNAEENRFIYETNKRREIWFGLNDRTTEGNYVWAGTNCPNTHLMFRMFNPGEPSNNRVENCIHHLTNQKWNDLTCAAVRHYVCSTPPSKRCKKEDSTGYHRYFHGRRFFIGIQPKNWHDAQHSCKEKGMRLARIDDLETNDYLFQENWRKEAWIGMNSLKKDKFFVWSDGCLPTWTHYNPGEPNSGTVERCVHYLTNGKWNDLPCNNQRRYICSDFGQECGDNGKPKPRPTKTVCTQVRTSHPCKCSKSIVKETSTLPAGAKIQGQVSLGFVVDFTGSMGEDIANVKYGAAKLLQTNKKYKVFDEFLVTAFNDPFVGKVHVTKDPEVAMKNLDMLPEADGGGDCPEKSLEALLRTVRKMKPGSFVFVFTDASASDPELLSDVLDVINKKKITVHFIATANLCGEGLYYPIYNKISGAQGGKIAALAKNEVLDVMSFMAQAIRNGKNALYSLPGNYHELREMITVMEKCVCPAPTFKKVCHKEEIEQRHLSNRK